MDLLVKKVTTVPKDGDALEVAGDLLAPVKLACKSSADSTKAVFYYASIDLKKRNGAVRIRALVLMDCLIHRSKQFRELVCADVKQIARCMGLLPSSDQSGSSKATNSDRFVAPATSYIAELESKGKELIEVWDHLYGDRYPQLRAIARYFRETLRLVMPNIMENARLHAERADRSKQHAQNLLLLAKDKILLYEWRDRFNEWDTSLSRLSECFAILFPRVGDSLEDFTLPPAQSDDAEGVEWEEDEAEGSAENEEEGGIGGTEGGSYSATGGAPYTLQITLSTTARELETADNSVLVQTIRELSRFLARSAVPRLLHYKEVFAGCAALYGAQIAELRSVEGVPVGAISGTSSNVGDDGASSAGSESSVLGKRASSSASSVVDAEGTQSVSFTSPAMAKLLESKQEVDTRLSEVLALLHKIRVMLTGKVRELLKDEVI